MHGNVKCCEFLVNDSFDETKLIKILNRQHLPHSILDDKSLFKWISKRLIPANRIRYDRIISNYMNVCDNLFKFILDSYALSLSDGYWLKSVNDDNTWETINYYDNDFNVDLLDIYLDSTISNECKPIAMSPSNNVCGILQKAWNIENGKRILLKRGKIEVYNEVIVSKILDEFSFDHVKYWFDLYNDKPVCKCENFTNENVELITASEIAEIFNCGREDIAWYMKFINSKVKGGEIKISNMLLIDLVLGNEDRHWNNFGVLRDIKTLKIVDVAPIYDNGNSLWISGFYNNLVKSKTTIGYNYRLKDLINKSYYSSKWKEALKLILTKEPKFETREEIEKQYKAAIENLDYVFS